MRDSFSDSDESESEKEVVADQRRRQAAQLLWFIQRKVKRRKRRTYIRLDFPAYVHSMHGNPQERRARFHSIVLQIACSR
jgi:hypothetical protein